MVDFIWLQKHNVTIYQQRSCRPTDKTAWERRWPWTLWCPQAHLETSLRFKWEEEKNKKASQQEAPYFLTILMTCALSCATNFDMDNALLKCHGQGKKNRRRKKKTQTIHVIVNVVASDIPSVTNSNHYSANADSSTAPAAVVGPVVVFCTARPLAPTHKDKKRFSDLLVVIGRDPKHTKSAVGVCRLKSRNKRLQAGL